MIIKYNKMSRNPNNTIGYTKRLEIKPMTRL